MRGKVWAALLLCGLLAGCAGLPRAQRAAEMPGQAEVLTVYVDGGTVQEDAANQLFKARYPEADVKFDVVEPPLDLSGKEALLTELRAAAMSGKGPDIFILRPAQYEEERTLLQDVEKAMRTGVFQDLLPLVEGQESWQPRAYQRAVLEAGMVDGALYALPLYYTVPVVQVDAGVALGADAPVFEIARCGQWRQWEAGRPQPVYAAPFSAEMLWAALERPLLDYDTGRAAFGDPLVRQIAALAWESGAALEAGAVLPEGPVRQISSYPLYLPDIGQGWAEDPFDCRLEPLRSESGGVSAEVQLCAAVSANCRRPQEAARFLLMLLEAEVQAKEPSRIGDRSAGVLLYAGSATSLDFPLRTGAMELWKGRAVGAAHIGEEAVDQCMAAARQVTGARMANLCAVSARDELTRARLAGEGLDETLDRLDAVWTRYLSE